VEAEPRPQQALLRGSIDVRSAALAILATLAAVFVLRWASGLFIPLVLGCVFYYALAPLVESMARMRIPRALSAAVLILGLLGGTAAAVYGMADDINRAIESLPRAAEKLRAMVEKKGPVRAETPLEKVQKAAEELERAAPQNPAERPAAGVRRVIVEKPKFNIRDHLWSSTISLVTALGQLTLVAFLTYFLLLSGDTFRRKLVQITGPTLSRKKITVQALDEINAQIHRYLMVQVWSSVGVGVVIGVAFYWLGMPNALAWGVATGVLNLIPYVGSIAVSLAAVLAAFIQFELDMALTIAGVCLVIQTIQGNLLVPWLTSQASRMNPVAVFISVLAWAWLWGVWGMLLGLPIMMVVKAVCDRVEDLQPVGELLGS